MFFLAYLAYWSMLVVTAFFWSDSRSPTNLQLARPPRAHIASIIASILVLAGYLAFLLITFAALQPWQRLFLGTVGLLHTIKWSAVAVSKPKMTLPALLLYMSIWPGLRPLERRVMSDEECAETSHRFARGYVIFWIGLLSAILLALNYKSLPPSTVGWLGLISLITMIHFGFSDVLSALMRVTGWNVKPLFDEPWAAADMREFWSRRWNAAFVEMNHVLVLPALRTVLPGTMAIFSVFLISGILHEIGISYAAGSGWGTPAIYFLIQGAWFLIEHQMRHHSNIARNKNLRLIVRVAALCCVLLPLPLLFTDAFRAAFVVPLFAWLHGVLTAHDMQWYVATALWCAATGNFCTMLAGLQVPSRLNWREELQRLRSFNRKIFINYYCYIGLMIAAWGTLTFYLHDEMMRGDRAALCLAGLIAMFWSLRVLVDFLYFKPVDWPGGSTMVIGRAALSTLFVLLSLAYWLVIAWHAFN